MLGPVHLHAQERGITVSLAYPLALLTASQARHAPRLAPYVDAYERLPDRHAHTQLPDCDRAPELAWRNAELFLE